MIPAPAITAWGLTRPWPTRASIEQDLILARLIVEIYHHPALRDELVFRGGTCLHQVTSQRLCAIPKTSTSYDVPTPGSAKSSLPYAR